MDGNSWRSTQGSESAVDSVDWRSQLLPDSRERVVLKIMDTLKRQLPHTDGPEGMQELKTIASKFEEKIFSSATNQVEYLRKISLKMLSMETKSNTANSTPPNSAVSSNQNSQDPGSNSMQAPVVNQGQQIPRQTGNTQIQARQQVLSQNIQNSIVPVGIQGSSGVTPTLSSISGLPSTNMPNVASQNSNLQNIQNMSGIPQNMVENVMGQGISSSMIMNSQRQVQGRQQIIPQQQQQHRQKQHSQNQQNYLFQQQLMKSKYQQGNVSHSVMQSHMMPQQQQAQQQPNIMPSSQQPSGSLSGLQQNQQISVHQPTQSGMQKNSQPIFRQQQLQQQASMIHQQQQSNATNLQQQLNGQQNSISDTQQQQQRMLSQQINLPNMQQQQQLTSHTNNISTMRHQQMSSLKNGVRLPQQSITQSGSSNMQTNQLPLQIMSKVPLQPQSQQGNTTLFPSSVQSSQQQPSPQQSMAQMQSQTGQLQQQLGMQQQPNLVQRDMSQNLQTSDPLLQQQNKIDPQNQLFQSQHAVSEASSTSLDSTVQNGTANSADWQEETYQKIKVLKDKYLPDIIEMHQRIGTKIQQHDSVQQPKNEQIEKLRIFRTMLERIISMLQISKNNVLPTYGDKLPSYEKQIINILNTSRLRQLSSTMPQENQLGQSQIQSMQQQHTQSTQLHQTHDNQMNAQLQQTGMQNPMSTKPQNVMTGQGNQLNNMQAVPVGSLQENPLGVPQQVNSNVLQPNLSSAQSNPIMLPSQHVKSEQKMLQTQPLKHQRQIPQQLLHRQILQQQQQPQLKQTQFQSQQMSQMNDINDLKMRQQLASKSGVRAAYQQQQMKSTTSFPISSPQNLQAISPQFHQQQSPQIDQQNILSSITRTGTPLSSTNTPLIAPSPSTPFVPSPMIGESEKGGPSVLNVGNVKHNQASVTVLPSQSLAVTTPGISTSSLLESTSPENHANASTVISGNPNGVELPVERLIRVVKSMSANVLSDSMKDIGSIVGMIDRMAGSAPGNGSRASIGEDLAAMTKCRLQTNSVSMQEVSSGVSKMKRYSNENFMTSSEAFDVESTATSRVKRPRLEANHSLLEEIRDINQRLIDTAIDIIDEDGDHTTDLAEGVEGGTMVKCSYNAVALSPTLKSQYLSSQMLTIQPLRLFVPNNYPNCSPVLLDKLPTEPSNESEDLSTKTKSRFSIQLRTLSQPMSLGEIARTWDVCSRAVVLEYAQQKGGGSFSSKYGTWDNCLSAV